MRPGLLLLLASLKAKTDEYLSFSALIESMTLFAWATDFGAVHRKLAFAKQDHSQNENPHRNIVCYIDTYLVTLEGTDYIKAQLPSHRFSKGYCCNIRE
jgi:hypothetical protein